MSEFFFGLTPDAVLQAVGAVGLAPTGHVNPLTCLENRVYDVRLEDESHVVVKFYRPERWSREAILAEHQFLTDLRDAEIPVCAPLAFRGGATLHCLGEFFYAIWPRTGGRSPDELTDDVLPILGRLLARIHNVGAVRAAPQRPHLTAESYALEPLEFLETHAFFPPEWAHRYRVAVQQLAAIYGEWSRDVPAHRIHGDCHLGNLLHGREGWFFLDFDDFLVGPAVHDLWMLVPGRDTEGERQRALTIEAYREFRDFDASWLRLVEPLRSLRFVRYAAWLARRWQDPAFPAAFPHFGTSAYWEQETLDLEEQLERLLRGADALPAGVARRDAIAEPELSNKDFFWDL